MRVLIERHEMTEKKTFRIDCPYCGSSLEYTSENLIKTYFASFVDCPVCRTLIKHDEKFEVK